MTLNDAKQIVQSKYPWAAIIQTPSFRGQMWYVLTDGTTFRGKWLTGKHRSVNAAWIRAAKNHNQLGRQRKAKPYQHDHPKNCIDS